MILIAACVVHLHGQRAMSVELRVKGRPGTLVTVPAAQLLEGVQQVLGENRDRDVSIASTRWSIIYRCHGCSIDRSCRSDLEDADPVKQLGHGEFLLIDIDLQSGPAVLLDELGAQKP